MGKLNREKSRTRKVTLSSDGSKMVAITRDVLTIQEHLQDLSITHWGKPIDEALDLHVHSRHIVTTTTNNATRTTTLASDSWSMWSKQYCNAMAQLVQLVSPAEANQRLSRKMAAVYEGQLVGLQPWMVRQVVADVKGGRVRGPTRSIAELNGRGKGRGGPGQNRDQSTRRNGSGFTDVRGERAITGGRGRLYVGGKFRQANLRKKGLIK